MSSAQSAIVGLLTDDSGGVLPGVTVEATSPAMIEGATTSVVTDNQGRYRFEAMRPGTYKLTFSLTGFGTVVREGVSLPSNFTATVNAEMKVGALEETINVSGTAPQVDVQQASRTTVIARDVIDSLPISRNVMGLGVLAAGVKPNTPDVGGIADDRAGRPARPRPRRLRRRAAGRGHVDPELRGRVAELLRRHAAVGNDGDHLVDSRRHRRRRRPPQHDSEGRRQPVQRLGIHGRHERHLGGEQHRRQLALAQLRGAPTVSITSRRSPARSADPSFSDKLWWIFSARHQSTETTIANVPKYVTTASGETLKATNDLYVRSLATRLTWQATQKYKIAGFFERWWHKKGHSIGFGTDVRAGEQRDPKNAHHAIGNIKVDRAGDQQLAVRGRIFVRGVLLEGRPSDRVTGAARRRRDLLARVDRNGADRATAR